MAWEYEWRVLGFEANVGEDERPPRHLKAVEACTYVGNSVLSKPGGRGALRFLALLRSNWFFVIGRFPSGDVAWSQPSGSVVSSRLSLLQLALHRLKKLGKRTHLELAGRQWFMSSCTSSRR